MPGDRLPHLRDVPASRVDALLAAADVSGPDLAQRVRFAVHGAGALTWDELSLGRRPEAALRRAFRFDPLLEPAGERHAEDGTRKFAYRLRRRGDASGGEIVEFVFIKNRANRTLCVSSQAGCAMGCSFCATGEMGLLRNMSAGEITEGRARIERITGERVTDVVFMGMGEPLHNYDAVMDACENLNAQDAGPIARKRITVSTSGLPARICQFATERRPWRLHLSLHSAIQSVRERIMPVARVHPLEELVEAMRFYQRECSVPWVTLQYVALPGVNMDDEHVDALADELRGLRYILNVIPWNDTGAGFRPPSWAEVKDFTTRLRRLNCPVKIRYSAGKQAGMGCGQLSAETVAFAGNAGHMLAPPGVFTG